MAHPARALAACLAVLLAATLPAVEAKPQPQVYFLKDAEVSPGHRSPVGDGELSSVPPPPLPDPAHPENTTLQPSSRVIFPYSSAVVPTQFVGNATANTGRISGVIVAYLFLPATPALQSATLNVTLVALPKDPVVPPPVGGGGTVLAWGRVKLDYNSTALPNATSFVPPNATQDPQGAVNYTAGQLVAYGITTVYSSGKLVFLDDAVQDYLVDVTVDPQSRLALRMVLENGSAYSPAPGVPPQQVPVPVGAGQDIVYDFGLAFSLVMVPWYAADPVVTTTSSPPPPPPPPASSSSQPTATTTTKESPAALGMAACALMLVGVAMVLARRKR